MFNRQDLSLATLAKVRILDLMERHVRVIDKLARSTELSKLFPPAAIKILDSTITVTRPFTKFDMSYHVGQKIDTSGHLLTLLHLSIEKQASGIKAWITSNFQTPTNESPKVADDLTPTLVDYNSAFHSKEDLIHTLLLSRFTQDASFPRIHEEVFVYYRDFIISVSACVSTPDN